MKKFFSTYAFILSVYALIFIAVAAAEYGAYRLVHSLDDQIIARTEVPSGEDLSPGSYQIKQIILGKLQPYPGELAWLYKSPTASEDYEWAIIRLQLENPDLSVPYSRKAFLRQYCHLDEFGKRLQYEKTIAEQ